MIRRKLVLPVILGSALCLSGTALAQQGGFKPGPSPDALAAAIQNCPGLNGKIDAAALAKAAQNCPGLNGTLQGKCPGLNGPIDPAALAKAAQNCPALNGELAAAAQNCPAFQDGGFVPLPGGKALDKKIDKKMNRITRALERNKQSAEALIQAAKDAGADPNAISDMEKMSAAFRQVFMSTVSPQQIVESILAAPRPSDQPAPQGIIITGPDGSTWLVTPNNQSAQPQGRPVPPKGPRGPKAQMGQSGPDMGGQPMMQRPPRGLPPQAMPPQGFRMPPQQQPAPQQGQMIIMEEAVSPQYMPLWPTKEDLGKDGVLKYLEKRSSVMNAN